MQVIGCDLHARQQAIAMLDTDTGELVEKTLDPQGWCQHFQAIGIGDPRSQLGDVLHSYAENT
jgi:hypothetical protein